MKVSDFERVVILTGAGISAESGLATFRDSNGLWENHRVEDVATPEAFERDPVLVWRFYSMRRQNAWSAQPNAAHLAIADFIRSRAGSALLVTQNVDGLHERAHKEMGAALPLAMHGTLGLSRCCACEKIFEDRKAYSIASKNDLPQSSCCGTLLRPHIVWFGEMPLHMDEITEAVENCDLFVSIGTSGNVYPAAGFIQIAKLAGAATVCINREPIPQQGLVDHYIEGPASQAVPQFLAS